MRPWRSVWSAPSWIAYISLVTALHERVRFGNTEWDDESWTIRSTLLDPGHYQSRMSLGNGYLGINAASTGPFFEVDHGSAEDSYNGWPLFNKRQTFASIAGFYTNQEPAAGTNFPWLEQYGKESFLAGIPHWSGLVVEADGHFLNSSVPTDEISHYSAKLDVSAGLLSWEYTWAPLEGIEIGVEYSMLVHKLYVNQAAVRLGLKASRDINVTVHDVIEGNSAGRSNFVEKKYETTAEFPTIWTAVTPTGVDVIAYVYSVLNGNEHVDLRSRSLVPDGILGDSHDASIAQSVVVQLLSGKPAVVEKSVGIASADAFDDPQSVARHAAITGAKLGWARQLRSHAGEWASILTKDSVDSYRDLQGHLPKDTRLQELQVISITIPFMILQHTVGPNAISAAGNNPRLNIHSIPVCGWASDCYGGLVFWDAETWMAMGLQVSHPKHIETVINYRVEKYPQARENVKTAFTSSKNQTGRFTGGHGAVYPWTSARYGNCTGTGPCFDYEYHVNGDIANTFRNQLAITGDAQYFNDTLLPITNDLVYFLSEALDFNTTSGYYELWNATDPDEYANNVNNVGFGTALIQSLFRETNELNAMFGRETNKTWNMMSKNMRLPVNEEVGIILEYEGQNGSISVKQADVVLIDDILHYENPYSLSNLDYYANKQSIDGPGMTYAAFSVVANEISPSGCSSYTYDAYSSQPWLRAPWFQFSEQLSDNYLINGGTHPAFPFLTGMGGANRIAIFGYLGLRLFVDRLDINPSLPPQIEHINYRTFYWQGYGINATSNSTHTTLARLPTHILPTADKKYCTSPIPVTLGTRSSKYWLGTEPVVVPNRMIGHKATVKNNVLQCKPIVPANYAYQPGQFPIAAIDGAASTKWQPQDSAHTNYLSVDLGAETSFHPLRSVLFDWGSMPPAYYEVLFTNISLPPFNAHSDVRNVTAGYVDISEPYDPKLVDLILPVKGNQTNVTLAAGQWSGRYAHLGIRGNLWGEGVQVGATVAEWSVVAEADAVGLKWRVQAGY